MHAQSRPREDASDPRHGVTVRADRARAARQEVESRAGFATSLDVRSRSALAPSLTDLLVEAPGVHPRSTGDALSPSVLTMRGAPATHVTVALDGVVLNDAAGEGVDLSLIPPSVIERIDVYRGSGPIRLGVSGLGGAVELITRDMSGPATTRVAIGYGSFAQRRALASMAGGTSTVRGMVALAYRGTSGAFPYYDGRGTDLDTRDDRIRYRTGNQGDAFDALARGCIGGTALSACAWLLTGLRVRGMPGPASVSYDGPELSQTRILGRFSLHARRGAWLFEPYAVIGGRRERFRDEGGVIFPGLALDLPSGGVLGEVGAAVAGRFATWTVEPFVRGRVERIAGASVLATGTTATRWSALTGIDARLRGGPLELWPSLGIESIADLPDGSSGNTRFLASPRIGVRVRFGPAVEARANIAHLERSPSVTELYGIGGVLSPNPALVPERSDGGDVGWVATARGSSWDFRAEGAAFARHAQDLIVLVRQDNIALKPFNLRNAFIAGGEGLVRLAWREGLETSVGYTFTHAVTLAPGTVSNGRRPPNIPAHDLHARVDLHRGAVRAWTSFTWSSGIYYDEANSRAAPPNSMWNAGFRWTPVGGRGIAVDVMMTNLLDQLSAPVEVIRGTTRASIVQPLADFAGFPLPGRSVFAQLSWTLGAGS